MHIAIHSCNNVFFGVFYSGFYEVCFYWNTNERKSINTLFIKLWYYESFFYYKIVLIRIILYLFSCKLEWRRWMGTMAFANFIELRIDLMEKSLEIRHLYNIYLLSVIYIMVNVKTHELELHLNWTWKLNL